MPDERVEDIGFRCAFDTLALPTADRSDGEAAIDGLPGCLGQTVAAGDRLRRVVGRSDRGQLNLLFVRLIDGAGAVTNLAVEDRSEEHRGSFTVPGLVDIAHERLRPPSRLEGLARALAVDLEAAAPRSAAARAEATRGSLDAAVE